MVKQDVEKEAEASSSADELISTKVMSTKPVGAQDIDSTPTEGRGPAPAVVSPDSFTQQQSYEQAIPAECQAPYSPEREDLLVSRLRDSQPGLERYLAPRALAQLGTDTAYAALSQTLIKGIVADTKDDEFLKEIITALDPPRDDKAEHALLAIITKPGPSPLKEVAAGVLGNSKSEFVKEELKKTLYSKCSSSIEAAALAARAFEDQTIAQRLTELMQTHPKGSVRKAAVIGLRDTVDEELIQELIMGLGDDDVMVRLEIENAIRDRLDDPVMLVTVFNQFGNQDPRIREVLGGIIRNSENHANLAPVLIDKLYAADPETRWTAAYALGNLEKGEYEEEILRLFRDTDSRVRKLAVTLVKDSPSEEIQFRLMEKLSDITETKDVRFAAAQSLHWPMSDEISGKLSAVLDREESEEVREALEKILCAEV